MNFNVVGFLAIAVITQSLQLNVPHFSATFPQEVQQIAKTFLKDNYQFLTVGIVGSAQTDVSQQVLEVDGRSKTSKVKEVLDGISKYSNLVSVKNYFLSFIKIFLSR